MDGWSGVGYLENKKDRVRNTILADIYGLFAI